LVCCGKKKSGNPGFKLEWKKNNKKWQLLFKFLSFSLFINNGKMPFSLFGMPAGQRPKSGPQKQKRYSLILV
jgi:hypothetical protein